MSAIDALTSIIYHEKQQPGSMLCAQHALNSLLQGNYYSAPDLSQIASTLDALEESYDDANQGRTSTNMDDTGFFSVQVIEQALQVWGLHSVRWRSEEMREYQDHPERQLAFILNLEQHWFTLRRFGELTSHTHTSAASDQVGSQWFNLNSFLEKPELVSKTYLGMVLQQAESEGYSVFAIVQTDPHGPVSLPHTRADEVASTLPEPASYGAPRLSTTREPQASTSHIQGFEDEDMELQAALQASLGGLPADFVLPPPAAPSVGFPPEISEATRPRGGPIPPVPLPPLGGFPSRQQEEEDVDPDDPVAASMARNRAIMERMKREQEMALREQYEEEAAHFGRASSARRGGDDNEDEMLRRVIEESQALANAGPGASTNPVREEDVEDEMETDADRDDEYHPAPSRLDPLPGLQPLPPLAGPDGRVLDDEDAELQAALRASLESVPEGFVIPDTPPRPSAPPVSVPPMAAVPLVRRDTQDSDMGSEADTSTSTEISQAGRVEEENVSVDEMRRRRLARFGGP